MTRLAVVLLSLLTVLPAGLAIPASNHYLDHDLSSFQEAKPHHHHHGHHCHCHDHNATTSAVGTTEALSTSVASTSVATTETLSTTTETTTLASTSTSVVITASSESTSLASTSSANATSTSSSVPTTSVSVKPSSSSSSVSTTSVSTRTSSSSVTATSTPSTVSSATKTSASSSSTGTSTSATDINAYLIAHNSVRKQHGAANLQWNETLAAAAKKWTGGCVMKHSNGTVGPYGENLAAGAGGGYNITTAVVSWTNESSSFVSTNPKPSHFTQVVWKSTTQLGCASQLCDGIFPAEYGKAVFVTCEYYPPGNVAGGYADNVQA